MLIWVYLLAMAMNGFESTVVAPALPDMARDLQTDVHGVAAVEWVFLLTSALALPAAAWVGRRFGVLRVVTVCLLVFTAGLVVAALADDIVVLCLARVLQGVSSGLLTPVALAMVYGDADGATRLRIARVTMIPLTIAPMLGPVAGGALTSVFGWRAVFAAVIPIALSTIVLAMLAGARGASVPAAEKGRADPLGLLLTTLALGGVSTSVALLTSAAATPDLWLVALLVISLLVGVAAVRHLRSSAHPAVDLGLWRSPMFTRASGVTCAGAAALMGVLFVTPLLLREQGATPMQIGLVMLPETFGLLVGSQLLAPAMARLGPRALALAGLTGAAVAGSTVLGLGWWGGGIGTATTLFVFGVCLSQPVLLSQAAAFADVEGSGTSDATGLFMMQRTLAGSAGVLTCAVVAGALALQAGAIVVVVALGLATACALTLPQRAWRDALTPVATAA